MRAAFVVGFFSPVEVALKAGFKPELDARALVFLGKSSPHEALNFHKFKSQFYQAASRDDPDPILVVAAQLRSPEQDWVKYQLESIVDSGRERGREIRLVYFPDAQNADPVVDVLHDFSLGSGAEHNVVTEAQLRTHTKGKKVLCVRGKQQSSFENALRRANFQFRAFEDYFIELDLGYGSNVSETVGEHAKRHDCLLYAWGELRYLQPKAKKKWGALHQGPEPAAAVARFKQAVLGDHERVTMDH